MSPGVAGCHGDVTEMSRRCHRGVTRCHGAVTRCHRDVTRMSRMSRMSPRCHRCHGCHRCHRDVTDVTDDVTGMSRHVTCLSRMSRRCHGDVTKMSRRCHRVSPPSHRCQIRVNSCQTSITVTYPRETGGYVKLKKIGGRRPQHPRPRMTNLRDVAR